MTLDSSSNPLPNSQASHKRPASSEPKSEFNPLNDASEFPLDISIETLEVSDENRLSRIVSESLGSADLTNQFAGCLLLLCEDPSDAALVCKDRLCRVAAKEFAALGGDNLLKNVKRLYFLSVIANTIIEASVCCPQAQHPQGLHELLKAEIRLLHQLENGREGVLRNEGQSKLQATTPPINLLDWMNLYLTGMNTILVGMESPGFDPGPELIKECRGLALAQLSCAKEDLRPTDAKTSLEAALWAASLDLAQVVADGDMERPLREISQGLLRWFNNGDWDAALHQRGDDGEELQNTLDFLEQAELYAMSALLRAQESCSVESLWKEVLETRPLSSQVARIALQGLAKSHADETTEYVTQLLRLIGASKCPPKKASRYLNTLILAADQAGMHEVIVNSWHLVTEYPANPSRSDRLRSYFSERLYIHSEQEERALAKIQRCGDNAELKEEILSKAARRGAIWSARALKTLRDLASGQA